MSLVDLLLRILDISAKCIGLIIGIDKLHEIWRRVKDNKNRRDKG
ncbi:hypothetical protein [Paenibacillus bovis]|nr:hypothetical protein [Paenibacillus bovis]